MPIYEYKCNDCKNNFEALVLGNDAPSCPSCASKNLAKMISSFAFKTKGSSSDSVGQMPSSSASSACGSCSATNCSTCSSG